MKTALAILALAVMTASAEETEKLEIPKAAMQQCRDEGGCVLVTKAFLLKLLEAVEQNAKTCRRSTI